jgi:Peroxidase
MRHWKRVTCDGADISGQTRSNAGTVQALVGTPAAGAVSAADLVALAGARAVAITGGPAIDVPIGGLLIHLCAQHRQGTASGLTRPPEPKAQQVD